MLDRRTFLASSAAAALPAPIAAAPATAFRPEHFGARGDGKTNDTAAFAALGEAINRAGGGTIALTRGRTYVVGAQRQGGGGKYGWNPDPVLELRRLNQPLLILGNGARLIGQPGLRFGTFDPNGGEPVHRPMPNFRREELASPYKAMIWIEQCSAPIEIRDLELDGNVGALRIGGKYGDKGWQIWGDGLFLRNNRGSETITNVHTHHHPRDGVQINGDDARPARSRFSRLIARSNGRQGVSIVGGRGYDFADCEFSQTGRAGLASGPGAGVDIEAEGKKVVRDLSFTRCRFVDNRGCGMVADSGDSADVRFIDCLFVGTTNWSAWPNKPDFQFDGCTFVGAVVHAFAEPLAASRATRFTNCRFTDNPARSPTRQVYVASGPIVNLAKSDNVLFDRCQFDAVANGILPWSWKAVYRDCTMRQRSPKTAMTKGKYLGTSSISGPVDLHGSMIVGSLTVNGRAIPRGPVGVQPW